MQVQCLFPGAPSSLKLMLRPSSSCYHANLRQQVQPSGLLSRALDARLQVDRIRFALTYINYCNSPSRISPTDLLTYFQLYVGPSFGDTLCTVLYAFRQVGYLSRVMHSCS